MYLLSSAPSVGHSRGVFALVDDLGHSRHVLLIKFLKNLIFILILKYLVLHHLDNYWNVGKRILNIDWLESAITFLFKSYGVIHIAISTTANFRLQAIVLA